MLSGDYKQTCDPLSNLGAREKQERETQREKCLNTEFFMVRNFPVFSPNKKKIRTRKNSVFGHFSCNEREKERHTQKKSPLYRFFLFQAEDLGGLKHLLAYGCKNYQFKKLCSFRMKVHILEQVLRFHVLKREIFFQSVHYLENELKVAQF